MSIRTALVCSLVAALALTGAGCSSSGSSGGGPSSSAPPTIVPSHATGHNKKLNLKGALLKHVPGSFKQTPDANVNKGTGFTAAAANDPRKPKRSRRSLHRDRFVETYQRVWTGFGDSTIQIVLFKFQVVGGPRAYQSTLSQALKVKLGQTDPVTVPGIGTATGFTQKDSRNHETTYILASVGVVMMLVKLTGKVALGQVQRAVAVATRQFKRL